MSFPRSYFILLLALAALDLVAQPPGRFRFKNLSIEEGLSHVTVNAFLQDRYGQMWIGTTDGLNRFDGHTFEVFRSGTKDSLQLGNNDIKSLAEDHQGRLWIGTREGLYRYDPITGHFMSILPDRPYVRKLIITREDVWVATTQNLSRVDPENGSTRVIFQTSEAARIRSIEAVNNRIWILAGTRLHHVELDQQQHHAHALGGAAVTAMGAQENRLVLATGQSLVSYDGVAMKRVLSPAPADIYTLMADRSGALWMGTETRGLYRWKDEVMTHYQEDESFTESLRSNQIRSLYESRSGLVWVGTWGGGLSIYDPIKERFKLLEHVPGEAPTLSNPFVQVILHETDSVVWIGTQEGLNRWDRKTGAIQVYHTGNSRLPHNYIKALFRDRRGSLWVGTVAGILKMDRTGRQTRYRHDPLQPQSISSDDITFFHEDSKGRLWIGTWNGINRYRAGEDLFERYCDQKVINDDHSFLSIVEDRGDFWLGTYGGGLVRFATATGTITGRYEKGDGKSHGLMHNRIWALHKDVSGTIWVGTFGGGLHRMKRENGTVRFVRFSTVDGLANNAIIGIESDASGVLWVSSNHGITRFDPASFQITNYDAADGLQGNHFNAATHCAPTGELYFGGSSGLSFFDPEAVQPLKNDLPVLISGFELFNKKVPVGGAVLPQSLLATDTIRLDYSDRVISLEFVAIDFMQPGKLTYRYRLSGFDQDWITAGADRRYVTYTSIPAGKYAFQVSAVNTDGHLSGDMAELAILVRPPWWETLWFRVTALLSIAGIFYVWYKRRIDGIERQKRQLELQVKERTSELKKERDQVAADKVVIEDQAQKLMELDRAKSKFFANISHELRTPLTLINAPLLAALEGELGPVNQEVEKALQTAQRNGANLMALVEEILDLAKLQAGKLELVNNPFAVAEGIEAIYEPYAYQMKANGVKGTLHLDLPDDLTILTDSAKFSKILNNLLSNAVKFTPQGGSITVSARTRVDDLVITVADTGRGIHEEDLPHVFDRYYQAQKDEKVEGGTGIGLALSKELALLFGGDLIVESVFGEGATFCWQLPVTQTTGTSLEKTGSQSRVIVEGMEEVLEEYQRVFDVDRPVVVIAEDNAEMREFIVQIFEPYFTIYEASDGHETWQHLPAWKPDLLVCDWMMPRMDGYELLQKIKSSSDFDRLSMIMLTARAAEEDKLSVLNIGVDDYLTKPFNKWELLARVKNLLRNRIGRELAEPEPSVEKKFMEELQTIIRRFINDSRLSVSFLASEMAMSERQLQRKIKSLTGFSPKQLITEIRLQESQSILKQRRVHTVGEVAHLVGFDKPEYFSQQFVGRFGRRPSDLLKG